MLDPMYDHHPDSPTPPAAASPLVATSPVPPAASAPTIAPVSNAGTRMPPVGRFNGKPRILKERLSKENFSEYYDAATGAKVAEGGGRGIPLRRISRERMGGGGGDL